VFLLLELNNLARSKIVSMSKIVQVRVALSTPDLTKYLSC